MSLFKMGEDLNKFISQFILKFIFCLFFFSGNLFLCPFIFASVEAKALPDEERNLNILLITLDTTRADRLGYSGYPRARTPNLDYLAREGACFYNAYSPVPLTLPSHCSIMTGTYPLFHQVRNNGFYYLSPESITLAEIMKENGFTTAAFVSSFTVDSRFGLDQGFDFYEDKFHEDEILKNFRSERRADQTFGCFLTWLDKNHRLPFFVWLHFYDPHLPYNPPSPFKEKFQKNPYDGEIAFVDFIIGKLIDSLKNKNLFENTLIVIAGDHGEALGERREIDHGLFLYDNSLKVPLIFFCPRILPSKKIYSRVRLIDIMPTLLDLMGITSPKQIQGISLKPYILGQKKEDLDCYIETVYPFENFGWAPLEGFIHNQWKLIVAPKRELYDIKQDPEESKNVIAEKKEIFAQLNIKLDEYKAKISARAEARPKIPSFKEAEKLRSLGYIGGPFESKSAKPLADPKDKIDDYLLYFRANLMETQGNYEKAVEYYRQVLNLNPDSPWNYVNLGFVFMKMNRVKEAISLLEQAKERFPHSIVILSRLMSFYLHDEKWEEALSLGQAILDIDPYYFDALFLMGSTQAKLGHWQAARDLYEKALKIEPENKILRQRYAYSLMASGEYEAAKRAYDILLNEFPSDYSIMLELALLYKITGKYDEATKILERASRECPGPDTYYAYALHLIEIKRKKEAIDYLKKYLELSTAEDKSRRARARVLLDELTKEIK